MMKNKNFYIAASFSVMQTSTHAGIRWEPEPADNGEGMPDWISYLVLMFVVLMIAGKFK